MPDPSHFEIPESVREVAQQNVKQARSAYSQFMDMARQAQDLVTDRHGAMAESAVEIQSRAMYFAEQNIDASLRFASELAKAKDLQEYVEIQSRYADTQMKNYAQQAQDLGRLISQATEKTNSSS